MVNETTTKSTGLAGPINSTPLTMRPSSPVSPAPAPPLEDENLLGEILLRLPPQPSSLPRASLVCKRWRRLVSNRAFLRRFRSHHRKPPLLGFFSKSSDLEIIFFTPALDPPDRIPAARFHLPNCLAERVDRSICFLLGCRDGLALFINLLPLEAIVWDPVTGRHRCVPYPPGLYAQNILNAAVLSAAGDDFGNVRRDCDMKPFKLVVTGRDHGTVSACLYESESGVWGDSVSIPHFTGLITLVRPGILVGNALCWALADGNILEFDLERQSLAVIQPPEVALNYDSSVQIMRTVSSGLGLAILTRQRRDIEMWERKSNSDGVVVWVLQKTVSLDKLLPLSSATGERRTVILGYAEDRNEIFLYVDNRVFMIQLESMQFKLLFESNGNTLHFPYTCFYSGDGAIGGEQDGPAMLNNT